MITQGEYVYISNPEDDEFGKFGKVTGMRPTAGLLRVDFTGKGDTHAIPFRRVDVTETPDNVTHHLRPVRDGGTTTNPAFMPTCMYCERTMGQLMSETDKTEPTRKPCPVALQRALGSRVPIRMSNGQPVG